MDFYVGLFVLTGIGVITGAVVLTSGVLEGRYDIYMRAQIADGLTQDTRVQLQGLAIGRITAVTPHLDSATNRLEFIATLAIRERFPDGTRLVLPRVTRAVITQPALLGATVVELQMPAGFVGGETLEEGDTIPSERTSGAMAALGEIAGDLRDDVAKTLEETRTLLRQSTRAVDDTRAAIASTTPQLSAALERLARNLDRTDHILAELQPAIGPLGDSVLTTLGTTRRALTQLEELATTANAMTTENRGRIGTIVESLEHTAQVLAHFADQVSRRPLRMLTGVTPPESTRNER
jgi:ABC-type transporter Mla subunit MlaD